MMIELRRLLSEWGYWLRNSEVAGPKNYPVMAVSKLNLMIAGRMEVVYNKPILGSVELVNVELNELADKRYAVIDRAIARLPKRRREAVMIEFFFCVNGTQEEKASYMTPPVKQNTYSELLNFALIQLSAQADVKNLLK